MELRDFLKLDILQAIKNLGPSQVISTLSESLKETGGFQELERVAHLLEEVAMKVAEFEEHYGSRGG